jgi:hypothetical protein
MWASLKCVRAFSGDDLHLSAAGMRSGGLSPGYGYSAVFISAGLITELFNDQDVSGWGIGVGISSSMLFGTWMRIGSGKYY